MTHLSLDDLGDVESAGLDPHVATCDQCRAAVADQRMVRDLLAGLPEPTNAPPEVVLGLQVRLRELRDTRDTAVVTPIAQARTRRPLAHRAAGLLAAAAAVTVLVGGGAALAHRGGAGGGTSTASSAAGTAATPHSQTARAPGVLTSSGTAYTRARLASQVSALITQYGALAAAPGPPSGGQLATGRLASAAGLQGCLQALGTSGSPLAVDLGTYDGRPAAVIVLPAAGRGRDVWVVARDCRPGADGRRYFTRLP